MPEIPEPNLKHEAFSARDSSNKSDAVSHDGSEGYELEKGKGRTNKAPKFERSSTLSIVRPSSKNGKSHNPLGVEGPKSRPGSTKELNEVTQQIVEE